MIRFIRVPGPEAMSTLTSLRSRYSETGEYPFIFTGREGLLKQILPNEETLRETIQRGEAIDFRQQLEERGLRKADSLPPIDLSDPELQTVLMSLGVESISEVKPSAGLVLLRRTLNGKDPEVSIGLARIAQPWHLPAALAFGGWNDSPLPELQVAAMKYWYQKYGAEVAAVSNDTLECIVDRPPIEAASALELALEHESFCSDIILQGTGDVRVLAQCLLNSKFWYFWWD